MRSILKLRINALAMKGIRRFGGGCLSRYLPVVFMLLPFGLPVYGQSINQGLVGRWPLQDDAPSTTVDATVGADGTLVEAGNTSGSSVAGPGGKAPRALTFDGTNDQVELGNQAKLNFTSTSPFTITAWVRPNNADTRGFIFSKTTGFATDGYGLYWRGDTNKIVLTNGTSIGFPRESEADFDDNGQWVHVAVSFDGTTATYYCNGVAAGTAGSYSFSSPTTANAKIGARTMGSPDPTISFDGELADVRVYDRALSQQNVDHVYVEHFSFLAHDHSGELFDLPGAVKFGGVTNFSTSSPNSPIDSDTFTAVVAAATGTLVTEGYSAGTQYFADINDVNNPPAILDETVEESIRNLSPPPIDRNWTPWQQSGEGSYALLARLAAKTRTKLLVIDFEPWANLTTPRNNYPYNLTATSLYSADRFENQIKYDSSKAFDPVSHLDRRASILSPRCSNSSSIYSLPKSLIAEPTRVTPHTA